MLGGDRPAVPAELSVVLQEGPQDALAVREAGLLEASGGQVEVRQDVLAAHEAGLLGEFAGQQVTEP